MSIQEDAQIVEKDMIAVVCLVYLEAEGNIYKIRRIGENKSKIGNHMFQFFAFLGFLC